MEKIQVKETHGSPTSPDGSPRRKKKGEMSPVQITHDMGTRKGMVARVFEREVTGTKKKVAKKHQEVQDLEKSYRESLGASSSLKKFEPVRSAKKHY